jgi:hypothetical protein
MGLKITYDLLKQMEDIFSISNACWEIRDIFSKGSINESLKEVTHISRINSLN